ncbi:MAG: YlbF family regulator [Phycisphaerales bacterium]
MPSDTDTVMDAARKLGELVADHETAKRYRESVESIEKDTETQRLMNDYNRFIMTLAEKESRGQPIEVSDKRKLEEMQSSLAMNIKIRNLQMAQMNYADLMRKIDQAVAGAVGGPEDPIAPGGDGEAAPPSAGSIFTG